MTSQDFLFSHITRPRLKQPADGKIDARFSRGANAGGQSDGPDDGFCDHPEIKRAADHDRAGIIKCTASLVPSAPIDFSSDELRQVIEFAAESE